MSCGDLLRVTAGDQVAEHGVQPAGDLVTQPGQVPVPLGPHLQHRPVVLSGHLLAGPGPQRRDRHGQRIVGVVLVRVPGLQQPHPGRQLGLHVQHPLAGRDKLLGQQPAQSRRRPRPPRSAPASPPPTPPASRPERPQARTRISPSGSSAALITTAVCDPLCGSTPIITATISTLHIVRHGMENVAGMPNYGSASARTSFEPRHGENPAGWHLDLKPDQATAGTVGRRFGSQPVGPHERYGTIAAPSGTIRRHCVLRKCRGRITARDGMGDEAPDHRLSAGIWTPAIVGDCI